MKKRNKIIHSLCFLSVFTIIAMAAAYQNVSVPAISSVSDKKTIILDAGHGGMDSGCVGINGCYEKDINLTIVKNLEQLLTVSGFEVILTRSEDVSIYDDGVEGIRNQKVSDMENRLEIVQAYPDSIFLSIHQNQFTQSEYFGGQMFYTTNNAGNFQLAQIMQSCFAELQPGNDREIKLIDNDLYLFKDTKQVALLIECGFLSNETDAYNLTDSEYQKKVAFTIYKGLLQYLNQSEQADVQITEEISGKAENSIYMQ